MNMESIVKSDIFFFVATITIIIVTVFLVAVLFYIVLILRDVKNISSRIREESKLFSEDLRTLRGNIKNKGVRFKHFVDFFGTLYKRNYRRKGKTH